MNQVIMTGNLTRDPETKRTQNGKLRATFGLAVQRGNNDTGSSGAKYYGVDIIVDSVEFGGGGYIRACW